MLLSIISGCLKLLPPEELQHLDIPTDKEPTNPVKRVAYTSENDTPYIEGNITLSQQHMEATRFNLFTGNQTLEQREKSFKVINCILRSLMWFTLSSWSSNAIQDYFFHFSVP